MKVEYTIAQDMLFKLASDKELTKNKLLEFIGKHKSLCLNRYAVLKDAYLGKYPILKQKDKDEWKPDNRIVVNFAKYLVDTMNGFFVGIPIKVFSSDEKINDYLNFLDKYNDQDDNNVELSKITSIYGKAYEFYYVDFNGEIAITFLNPQEAFMIYDDTVACNPLYFVYYYYDSDNVLRGSYFDDTYEYPFIQQKGLQFLEPKIHGFHGLPCVEYLENEERMSLFEGVYSMINAYNKALSDKANDVDYFGDAYLKILGADLDDESLKAIRDNRVINFSGDSQLVAEFLSKPNGDTSQENLINRLERLIFQTSMIPNINDENFGTATGIALKYRMLSMINLAKNKERKFTSGMNQRYKKIFSNPVNSMMDNDYLNIEYVFTQNLPSNVLEEAQIAAQLSGVVSQETQLKQLSIVDDVQKEIEKLNESLDPIGFTQDYSFSLLRSAKNNE